jgi:hypothetical protein
MEPELIGVFCPAFADVFLGRAATQRLERFCEIVGNQESSEMVAQLIVGVIMVAPDRGLFEGT